MKGLEAIFGAGARFKSKEQIQACQVTLEGTRDAIIRLPTGGGKSLSFLLAAGLEKALVTVVVVPTRALLLSYGACCSQLKVNYYTWSEQATLGGSLGRVVFVHVQDAGKEAFRAFLASLSLENVLKRVVFDECHLLVTWKDFHQKIRVMDTLRAQARVQFIFLSATLTKALIKELIEAFSMINPWLVYSSVDRPNLSYGVKRVGSSSMLPNSLADSMHSENLSGESRGIVYVLSKTELGSLVDFLGKAGLAVGGFSSDTVPSEKICLYDSWIQGKFNWMIATTGFGVGVDYAHVRAVLVYGGAFSGLDLLQMFGRAGRDGSPANCALITSLDYRLPASKPLVSQVVSFASTDSCLRKFILGFVEEPSIACYLLKSLVPCQTCLKESGKKRALESQDCPPSKKHSEVDVSTFRTQERIQSNLSTQLEIKAKIEGFGQVCILCKLDRGKVVPKHLSIYQCPSVKGRCIRCMSGDCLSQRSVAAKCPTNQVDLAPFKVCFYCGLPLYAKYHSASLAKNNRESCSSSGCDSIRALSFLLLDRPEWKLVLDTNIDGLSDQKTPIQLFQWLHQPVVEGVNNLCLVFLFWTKNQALF